MSHKLFTPEVEKNIAFDFDDNMTIKDMKIKYGGNASTLRRVAIRNGATGENRISHAKISVSEEKAQNWENRWLAGESQQKIAKTDGCSQAVVSRVLLRRGVRKSGETHRPTGPASPSWRGGLLLRSDGYWMEYVENGHPFESMRGRNGYVQKHRLVMAEHLGRPLTPKETVHHIDKNPGNYKLSNLQLRNNVHGKGASLHCKDCGSVNIISALISDVPIDYNNQYSYLYESGYFHLV